MHCWAARFLIFWSSDQVYIPDSAHVPSICLRVHLPADYPASVPPIPELAAPHLSDDVKAWVVAELEGQFIAGKLDTCCCMYTLWPHKQSA